jgi:3-oxoacyl-[acyl-carrier-protein] synthase-3
MIQTGAASRVLLLVGDTISKLVDPSDRSTAFLFGDAGTATALEKSNEGDKALFILGTDGRGSNNLIVPSGSFRNSSSSYDEQSHSKNPNCLYMDGGDIFNFTLRSIPQLVSRIIEISGRELDTFDGFLFHQANYFMLKHLAKKSKIPLEKLPVNINNFGNTSSASIPLLMTTEIRDRLLNSNLSLCMFGFGVGYSWGAASMSVGPLDVVETIIL